MKDFWWDYWKKEKKRNSSPKVQNGDEFKKLEKNIKDLEQKIKDLNDKSLEQIAFENKNSGQCSVDFQDLTDIIQGKKDDQLT